MLSLHSIKSSSSVFAHAPEIFFTNNKFDVNNILKRLENSSTKPTTIQDLQTEIKIIIELFDSTAINQDVNVRMQSKEVRYSHQADKNQKSK